MNASTLWRGREVIALMGPPGSGKSTYAARFPIKAGTDSLRKAGATGKLTPELVAQVYEEAFARVAAALRANQHIVFDATLTNATTRARVLRIAKTYRAAATLVVFETPADLCVARQSGREHPVPEEVVRQMHATIAGQREGLSREGWSRIRYVGG